MFVPFDRIEKMHTRKFAIGNPLHLQIEYVDASGEQRRLTIGLVNKKKTDFDAGYCERTIRRLMASHAESQTDQPPPPPSEAS